MTRTYLLALRAACVVCVLAVMPLVGAAVDRGRAIDAPPPGAIWANEGGEWVRWTPEQWAADRLGARIGQATSADRMMPTLGAERCVFWVSALLPADERGPVWCWPRIDAELDRPK